MMKNSAIILNWTGTLVPADNELAEDEINSRFGGLMQTAVSAFRQDPSYIVEMAESAAALRARRAQRVRSAS